MIKRLLLSAIFALSMCLPTMAGTSHGGTIIPPAASDVGYTVNTYHVGPFTTSNVDMSGTYVGGFSFYPYNLSGSHSNLSNFTINPDGTMTLNNAVALASVGSIQVDPRYHGIAFGCGAYLTAEVSFDPVTSVVGSGYPAWWAIAWENQIGYMNTPISGQWTGQAPGYTHFLELDTFEFDRPEFPYPRYAYGATLRDWYGIYNVTCPIIFCVHDSNFINGSVVPPAYTDWNLYHRIAVLWVPAVGGADGYAQAYFDDVPMNNPVTWTKYDGSMDTPPITSASSWALGVIDIDHLILILGSGGGGVGVDENVRSVDVWQGPGRCNISN